MEILWIDQGPCSEPVTDAGKMSTTSDCVELKKVHFSAHLWEYYWVTLFASKYYWLTL